MARVNAPPPTPAEVRVPTVKAGMRAIVDWWKERQAGGYGPMMRSRELFEDVLTSVGRVRVELAGQALLVVLETDATPEDKSGAA